MYKDLPSHPIEECLAPPGSPICDKLSIVTKPYQRVGVISIKGKGLEVDLYKSRGRRSGSTITTMKVFVICALLATAAAWPHFGFQADDAGGKIIFRYL